MNTTERVRQEMRRFEASLPRLLPLYADRIFAPHPADIELLASEGSDRQPIPHQNDG